MDIVGVLLQNKADVDAVTKDSYTALHIAAKEGQEEVASLLLDQKADLAAKTKVCFILFHHYSLVYIEILCYIFLLFTYLYFFLSLFFAEGIHSVTFSCQVW